MKNLIICMLTALVLSSCSYAFKDKLRKSAETDIPFPSVQSNIERDIGSVFIWGGVIVNAVISDSINYLEVAQTPLDKYGKIINPEYSEGRFILYSPGGFDPSEYYNGLLLSVTGFLITGADSKVEGKDYTYPVMEAIVTRAWDELEGEIPPAYFPSGLSKQFQWSRVPQ
jgi:starvation-inducible outer membrane lipoprotein